MTSNFLLAVLSVLVLGISMTPGTSAFSVVPSSRSMTSTPIITTQLYASDPKTEEEGGLDLDLEEMFDMFDAADKDESFDDAIKKVKGDE
mmetsp:Transcript_51273/g.123788  ORF Transcript_51273/g.123788 Transcript_51273/m.123788 type:complete len:90 (-) Transcript_51273:1431-1700(-)|eukprot:CAMPEP_0113485794 /NCGR_PEP_ID=MMETSP0014_2-20120614/24667_1 /TAXON_ID=2857 /ORGANISM="Nitzschia sp." /LENGTH=89 /DNA_ID=CAMNT_0000379451 /DNA_START=97 /DNA_END=366 /DNA_ORIENTATION=+ /assembly_acc=CAM_ASM_000159